jgi:rubredoxin
MSLSAMAIGDAKEAKPASLVYQGKAPLSELNKNISREVFMDKYECTACGYIYDPAEGDPEHGIPKGTSFEELPDDWVCPLCSMGKDNFEKVA